MGCSPKGSTSTTVQWSMMQGVGACQGLPDAVNEGGDGGGIRRNTNQVDGRENQVMVEGVWAICRKSDSREQFPLALCQKRSTHFIFSVISMFTSSLEMLAPTFLRSSAHYRPSRAPAHYRKSSLCEA